MRKLLSISLLLTLLLAGCRHQEVKMSPAKPKVSVSTTKVAAISYSPVLSFAGTVNAWKDANLSTTLPGKVEILHCKEGDLVKAGEVLAELSSEMLIQAEIEYDALDKDFQRISRLRDKGSVTQMDYDHLKARLDAARVKVEMVRKNTRIVAPFSGTVVDILVSEGENFSLMPSVDQQNMTIKSAILEIMQLDPVKIVIDVSDQDLYRIRTGEKVMVSTGGKTFQGTIHYIQPVMSAISHTVKAEVKVRNSGGILKPGMYADVKVILPEEKGYLIPESAIYRQSGTSDCFVFSVQNSIARKVKVKVCQELGERVVVSGIAEKSEIVLSGKSKLHDGSMVRIVNR